MAAIDRAALPATVAIASYWSRGSVLAAVAGPMTAVDPARAERLARSHHWQGLEGTGPDRRRLRVERR
jgi:hypothetical protein